MDLGLRKRERIAFLAENWHQFFKAYFTAAKSGPFWFQ
jgi:hypothetical protein